MNQVLDQRFVENIQRLAVGFEPLDPLSQLRIPNRLGFSVEQPPKAGRTQPIVRHNSCLFALLYYPSLIASVNVRITDDTRHFVPRRFIIPIHTVATVDGFPLSHRARRPVLFPGAAYDVASGATGIRGRVLRGGQPMRWARVEAVLVSSGDVVGRAHGDDRGEFLLVVGSNAVPIGDLVSPVNLKVTVFGPAVIPVPDTPDLPLRDPLWDLPLETAPAPGTPDTVSTGETLPGTYTATTVANIDFNLGELRSDLAAFVIT